MAQMNVFQAAQEFTAKNGYACNADARRNFLVFCKENNVDLTPRKIKVGKEAIKAAYKIGSLKPGAVYEYETPHGMREAKVVSTYNTPYSDAPTVFVCFSGHMSAHIHTMEAIRRYAHMYNKLPEMLAIGRCGNKGLFEKVFNREDGIMIAAEYEAYYRAAELIWPSEYVRANQQVCQDMDTQGNFDELNKFAKTKGYKKVCYVFCTGNPLYEKRLLAEYMLWAKTNSVDVDMEIMVSHIPYLQMANYDSLSTEVGLGYIAAGIGPLAKDTIGFDGQTTSEKPERYLMDGVADADWGAVYDIITYYSNMGWPNYQELLYGIPHEVAVQNILISHVFAHESFNADEYDARIKMDIKKWATHVNFISSDEGLKEDLAVTSPISFYPEEGHTVLDF